MYLTAQLKSGFKKVDLHKKIIRVIKLTTIFLIAACLQVSAEGYAQKVSLNENNISLQKVFAEIRKQTGYQFFYADEVLKEAKRVSVNVKNASIEDVLDVCFKNQPLAYTIAEK